MKEIVLLPRSAWRTIELDVPTRKFKTPRVFDQKVPLAGRAVVEPDARIKLVAVSPLLVCSRGVPLLRRKGQPQVIVQVSPLRQVVEKRIKLLLTGCLLDDFELFVE